LHHIQPDHLGTPRKVIQTSNNTAIWDWPILGNAFGEAAPNQDPDGNTAIFTLNLRFPGQYFDLETGLHYNYFRDYEAGTGRYVESDPIGLWAGLSTYSYVLSRPTKRIDPKGLFSVSAGGEAGFHIPGTGGMGSASVGMDTEGKICFQFQACGRLGMGLGAGVGGRASISPNFNEGLQLQTGFYAEGGAGGRLGGSFGDGGVSLNVGAGMEVCAGVQTCPVQTICIADFDLPDWF